METERAECLAIKHCVDRTRLLEKQVRKLGKRKRVTTHSVSILRIKDDLMASERVYFDQLDMLTQLGLMPAAAGPNDHIV